jgi:DNA (cytosine-5)-methyltransferase 1
MTPMEATYSRTGSGLIVPTHIIKKKHDRPIVMDFFAGCGGFSLGFMQSGWTVVGAVEWGAEASLTYMTNLGSHPINIHYTDEDGKEKLNKACERYIFGKKGKFKGKFELEKDWDTEYGIYNRAYGSGLSGSGWIRHHPDVEPVRNFWFGDIRKIKGEDILHALGLRKGDLDCICGGPPCQGYSKTGKQNVADPRNNLVYEYARMIVELQPKTFVMEEVPAIVNFFDPDGVPVLDKFCLMLQDGGYGKWDMLKKSLLTQTNAAACIKGMKGSEPLKRTKNKQKAEEKKNSEEQMTLF